MSSAASETPTWKPHEGNKSLDFSTLADNGCYIVCASRSAIGKYGGALSSLSGPDIASYIIASSLKYYDINVNEIDEFIYGNVLQANVGQNPARQACLNSGIPNHVGATTVNKLCASGMKAMAFGSQSIELGHSDLIVCGGMESMSNAPYYLLNHRFGKKMGHDTIVDGMIKDGLWDVYTNQHMGQCAEICANKNNISRKEQDDFAIRSFKLAQQSNESGIFLHEIIPFPLPASKKQGKQLLYKDEGCLELNEAKLRQLKGAFDKNNGTITAGNASQLSDGAACIVMCSGRYLKKRYNSVKNNKNNKNNNNKTNSNGSNKNKNAIEVDTDNEDDNTNESKSNDNNNSNIEYQSILYPLCRILSYADAAQSPVDFPASPSLAIPKALKRIGMQCNEKYIDFSKDYFEINEAFAVAGIVNAKNLKIPIDNVNVLGGSVAIGHPIGCSGARIICTLINTLKLKNGRYGIAGICNGGGGASAMVIQNI